MEIRKISSTLSMRNIYSTGILALILFLNSGDSYAQSSSITTSPVELGDGPVDDIQAVDLSSIGATIGDTVIIDDLLADGDLNGSSEVFSLSINGSAAINGLQTGVQCNESLVGVDSPITENANVIDIGGGTPGIELRVQYGPEVNFCDPTFAYTVDISMDSDGDGIRDSEDLDDDNDGITDVDEQNCSFVDQANIEISIDLDAYEDETTWEIRDPSSNIIASGGPYSDTDDIISEITTVNTSGNYTFTIFDSFGDGLDLSFSDGTNENDTSSYTISVNDNEVFDSGNSPNFGSQNTVDLNISNLPFQGQECSDKDTDNDGIVDRIDLDSDNDGCSDANEYYADANADGGDDGLFGSGEPSVNDDGLVITASYDGTNYAAVVDNAVISGCLDSDDDGVIDLVDRDDDNDGVSDAVECGGILNYEFYDNVPAGNTVDNIPVSGADFTGEISDLDVTALASSLTGSEETYAIRYTGTINIPTTENYTFYTTSDDGSKLIIDGNEVVDNDGLHPPQEQSGSISLTQGLHQIEILFFENTGGDTLSVAVETATIAKVDIPFSYFSTKDCSVDTDQDGIADRLDLDSDDDGCSDANEYYNDALADGGDDGIFGSGNPNVNASGLVIDATYDGNDHAAVLDDTVNEVCIDTDEDGVIDAFDEDDDNDGILDVDEALSIPTPQAFWTFDNDLNDVSGNGNDPNLNDTSSPSFTVDALQGTNAAVFNGVDQQVRYSVNGGFMESNYAQISFSAWIKPNDISGNRIIYEEGGGTNGSVLWLDDGVLTYTTRNGGGSSQTNISVGNALTANDEWMHVAATFDNGTLRVYLNGMANSTEANYTNIPNHGSNGGIGGTFGGTSLDVTGTNFSGIIDAVRYDNTTAFSSDLIADQARAYDVDQDGIPNRIDLDADDDGCSDANEYYELGNADNNADGSDDLEFGNAASLTISSNGRVNDASYDGTSLGSSEFLDANIADACQFIQVNSGAWNSPGNWREQAVPTFNNDAEVAENINSFIDQDQELGDLRLNTGSEIAISGSASLSIRGNITNHGEMTDDGEIILNGTTNQVLSGDGIYNTLRIDNPSGATISGDLSIRRVLYIDQGDLNTNNSLNFICDFTLPNSTNDVGQVGQINGSINGEVTVEQCFPGRRAFRLLSSSTTTSGSIQDNWQEGAVNHLDVPVSAFNEPPIYHGYGTHITGSNNSEMDNALNNGFDWSASGNPSLFTFDNTNQEWNAVANTSTNTLTAGDPYRLMIRGDRSIDITSNAATSTNTKLRSTGDLVNSQITFSGLNDNEGFASFIGNPYQAAIDMNSVINNSTNLQQYFVVWDPTLGGQPQLGQPGGRGAFVTVDAANNTSNLNNSSMNRYLQPYQAAFVITGSGSNSPQLLIDQSDKAVDQEQLAVFSEGQQQHEISLEIYDAVSFANDNTADDGLKLYFSANANNAIDHLDAPKMGNIDENLAVWSNDSALLSIEHRTLPDDNEDIQLYNVQYRSTDYVYQIELDNLPGIDVYLKDLYTNEQVLLDPNVVNNYSFSVDGSIPESVAWNRFQIGFEEEGLNLMDIDEQDMNLYPNPVDSNEFTISSQYLAGKKVLLKIIDIKGNITDEMKFESFKSSQIIKLKKELMAGVYLVRLESESKYYTRKLIVK